MPFDLITVPCLSDNYAYLLHDRKTGETACIDVPEAGPTTTRQNGLPLISDFLTVGTSPAPRICFAARSALASTLKMPIWT